MKLIYLPSLVLLCLLTVAAQVDPIDNIANLIRHNNTHKLADLLAPSVEMAFTDGENVYSKTQASLVLEKFFSQNKPNSVKLLHKINSNPNYRFGVLILNGADGAYRLSFTLSQTDGAMKIIELRIEPEKTK